MDRFKQRNNAYNKRTEKTERNRQICKLRRNGWTTEQIGAQYGISMQAVSRIWNRDRVKYEM